MAQAQRKPEVTVEQLIRQVRELIERIRRVDMTDAQREQMRRIFEEAARSLQGPSQQPSTSPSTRPAGPSQTAPQSRNQPAPRRVEQFVYDVSVGTRTYRVALPEPLPTLPGGIVDMKYAQRHLHDLLLNNQLVTRTNANDPSSPAVPLAQVTMPGSSQGDQRFNAGTPSQRLDQFRDDFLKLTYHGGNYTESTAVRIAEAPHNTTRRN